jgi:hypothetical protein
MHSAGDPPGFRFEGWRERVFDVVRRTFPISAFKIFDALVPEHHAREIALWVEVGDDYLFPHRTEHPSEIEDGRGLRYPAFVVEEVDDFCHGDVSFCCLHLRTPPMFNNRAAALESIGLVATFRSVTPNYDDVKRL